MPSRGEDSHSLSTNYRVSLLTSRVDNQLKRGNQIPYGNPQRGRGGSSPAYVPGKEIY